MNLLPQKPLLALAVLGVLGGIFFCLWFTRAPLPWETEQRQAGSNTNSAVGGTWLEVREREADGTIWAKEMLAEVCGRTVESLWDAVNAATNKLGRIGQFRFETITLPEWGPGQALPHGIELRRGNPPGHSLTFDQWSESLKQWTLEGWQLENLEFRHTQFDTDTNGQPRRSGFHFSANLTNSTSPQRAALDGQLLVTWTPPKAGEELPAVSMVDASRLELKHRMGEPFFEKILDETVKPSNPSGYIDPLIVYDLDGDGFPEIILVAANLAYCRQGDGHYQARPLCKFPLPFIATAVVADFDADGAVDLLCANSRGLYLFKGNSGGTFEEPPRLVSPPDVQFKNAMVLTCGDVDGDGDLDVFVGQYKVPTLGQVLRPHYYDANDGWPAYLLLNDGRGNFTDVTETAGLGPKRWRRIYGATLADLDGDGHPDLVVASDFAGLDLYRNDSHGHFTEVTRQWTAESHGFGMALALADFNVDGRVDLLMIGMPSATVDRLQHADLWRPYSTEDRSRRPSMTFGNRLLLAQAGGGFAQTALSDSLARSGWSWGCGVFDFDNDGFPDVYIANGLETRQSVKDYESEFWLHNLYIDESVDDITASRYLMARANGTRGSGWSYGGYEKNRFWLNRNGETFTDIGHLAGVALEQDSRDVVAADVDGDGKVDLVLTTEEVWPARQQTLKVYRNRLQDGQNWIGFRFQEQGQGRTPVGTKVTIKYNGHAAVRSIVTGDSHRSQHPNVLHFGVGQAEAVETAEIDFRPGSLITLRRPALNQYHEVRIPAAAAPGK